ncbi:MAG: hypothetical protein QHG94_07625, partial [Candidatus Methanosuratincola sp.]|nr:hypothetical protein [Candidatus Methanosuratincola sp.]
EVDLLVKQLRIANEYDRPVIVYTPQKNKETIVEKLLQILKEECTEPSRVVVDHLTLPLVPRVRELGFNAGLTVQHGKLTPCDVKEVVEKHGPEGIIVNSGLGCDPSDPLAVLRTAKYLDRSGIGGRDIQLVTYSNARSVIWF